MDSTTTFSTLQLLGAGAFGSIVGWYVYFINRYRKAEVTLGDLTTVIGVIGGGAILSLFDAKTDLFGAYGIGLFIGFFGYFMILNVLVSLSPNFDRDWFLDGRRKKPVDPFYIPGEVRPTIAAMDEAAGEGKNPNDKR